MFAFQLVSSTTVTGDPRILRAALSIAVGLVPARTRSKNTRGRMPNDANIDDVWDSKNFSVSLRDKIRHLCKNLEAQEEPLRAGRTRRSSRTSGTRPAAVWWGRSLAHSAPAGVPTAIGANLSTMKRVRYQGSSRH